MAGLIVIGGPTASGKSVFALRLAEALPGVVINADSIQLYRELRILSARPSPAEEARVPHRLFGVLSGAEPASVGRWLDLAEAAIGQAQAQGQVAIVVGGTGLYLHALLHGLAPVPDVPGEVRAATRALFARLGAPAFHAGLAELDPAMAARLQPRDAQRLMRAHEVVVATGRSLAAWQALPRRRIGLPQPQLGFTLLPPRAALYARIAERLHRMVATGALDELAALQRARLPPELPLMKAVGIPELRAHLEGRMDLATALERAIVQTRRYAKRQLTFLRHQLPELQPIHAFGDDAQGTPDPEHLRHLLLTGRSCAHSVRCINRAGQ